MPVRHTTWGVASSAAAVVALVAAATTAPAGAATTAPAPTAQSAQGNPETYLGTIAALDDVFTHAEAVTAWPKGMCADVYTRIVGLSSRLSNQTAGTPRLKQLHDDALILNAQAKAMLPECVTFDSGKRPAQLENRYTRVDMQLWQTQLQFDLDHPRNHLAPTRTVGKVTRVHNPADRGKKDLKSYRDCTNLVCPTYVVIPKGTFMMGGTKQEQEKLDVDDYRRVWESPRHKVTIRKRYAMATTEVTRGQFAAFVKETGYKVANGCVGFPDQPETTASTSSMWRPGRSWKNPNFPQTDADPVVCVSRPDAQAYATWLSKKTGQTYRLPSEAEWEYAARAGTTSAYFWGNDDPADACTYANVYDRRTDAVTKYGFVVSPCDDGNAFTAKVGSYKPNRWGLYDVTGNAREWVSDAWEPNLESGPFTEAPRTAGVAQFPVLRGGGWDYMPQNIRIAYRSSYYSNYIRSNMWGIRLVREIH